VKIFWAFLIWKNLLCLLLRGHTLQKAKKEGHVVNVSMEMPKSFVLCCFPDGRETVYITPIGSATLLKRAGFMEELRNVNADRQELIK
jgi:hypothetical protein